MTATVLNKPATSLMTADEFYDFVHRPENRNRIFELDRGKVVEMSRPGIRHGVVCANVSFLFGQFTRQRGRGIIISNDAGLIVERGPDTVFGPDVFFYDEIISYDELPVRWEDRPPTLVVEVLSPTDSSTKVNRRVGRLLTMGVPLVWVFDPADSTLTVHQAHRPLVVLDAGDEVTGLEFVPDLKLKVGDFFATPGVVPASA
jgi:Uma2 family endonuclease